VDVPRFFNRQSLTDPFRHQRLLIRKLIAEKTRAADGRSDAKRKLALLRGKCRIGDVVSSLNEKWEAAS